MDLPHRSLRQTSGRERVWLELICVVFSGLND